MTVDPVVLIPARLESRRLPGKALADLSGVPMVIRCALNAKDAGLQTWVCSDSPAILKACSIWGVRHLLTPTFNTGTDRCTWAAQKLCAESILILQGDEPLISPEALRAFSAAVLAVGNQTDCILNGLSPLNAAAAEDPNNVKAVQGEDGSIKKLTRTPIASKASQEQTPNCFKQLGLYGGLQKSFDHFAGLSPSPGERDTSIEMLRWLEANLVLQGVVLQTPAISVDTESDLQAARRWLAQTSPNPLITPAVH
jgi:3-deoxy-manno-octulosonate cytidylyltransferase (CMP-KDO synthetase)